MLVIDTSASVQAASLSGGFTLLAAYDLFAPPLMWSEALSARRDAQWRGVRSPELTIVMRDRLLAAPVRR